MLTTENGDGVDGNLQTVLTVPTMQRTTRAMAGERRERGWESLVQGHVYRYIGVQDVGLVPVRDGETTWRRNFFTIPRKPVVLRAPCARHFSR